MTKKERIAELERELADVKRRLDVLEQRAAIFPQSVPVVGYRDWGSTGDPPPFFFPNISICETTV